MPNRGTMRAKQRRGGSLGQGTRFYYLGGVTLAKIAGAQGFGKTNPSIGSVRSLGIMKQNRNAGGNNICKETEFLDSYYTQRITINAPLLWPNSCATGSVETRRVLVYKLNSTQLLGSLAPCSTELRVVGNNFLPVGATNLAVTLVYQVQGFPGFSGVISNIETPIQHAAWRVEKCNCRGPKAYCSNCSGRDNPFNAITGGAGYSSTNGFTLLTH